MQTWEEIVERLKNPLPGAIAQWQMAPVGRARVPVEESILIGFRESAVLVPFIQREAGWHLVLTLRSTYEGVHSAQVSFPGGKFEEGEVHPEQVAIREAGEELGIYPQEIEIVGRLTPLTIPVSRMRVQPVIAKLSRVSPFVPDPREVHEVLEVPLHYLADRSNVKTVEVITGKDQKMNVPAFDLGKSVIWGATAMMISELLALVSSD
jgi:8-oxo-dGTP pyrophosphatase MutT (NUDIX family)